MARLMMSAAVPCIGALMAVRSAYWRVARVAGFDFGQIQAAAEQGFDIALLARLFADVIHVIFDAGITGEIQVDIGLRLAARQAELLRQPERGHAVNQSEIDRLGGAAQFGGDLIGRHAEHFGGSRAMHILRLR